MGGSVLFQDALKARLDLIKPSRQNFVDCLRERPATLSDGACSAAIVYLTYMHECERERG